MEQLTTAAGSVAKYDTEFQVHQQLTSELTSTTIELNHNRQLLSNAVEKKKRLEQQPEILNHSIADAEARLRIMRHQTTELEEKDLPQCQRDVCYWEDLLANKSSETSSDESSRDSLFRQKRKVHKK